ncbi:Lsr2 dimerization domain-containing protein [Nocardioides yefusunii]|uniref:Histone-like nucleoid-structuring protein Lsr2 n=1 Tax=Nocardioides yefusunii TaxID=2500546 RepID=A0ABW1QSM6_9ACTN|nr:histone-like nucleoid-structuring protein Lsr2 [Nocardioides yefusunii]
MAIRTIQVIDSDISGTSGAQTITFALGEAWYEVDLTPLEQHQLSDALQIYMQAGRRITPPHLEKQRVVPETTPAQRERIRTWARAQGLGFAERGRIPRRVILAWNEAHPNDQVV